MTAAQSPEPGARQQLPARRRFLVPAAILAVTALLIGAVLWTRPGEEQGGGMPAESIAQEQALPHPSGVALPPISATQRPATPAGPARRGPVDAPVAMAFSRRLPVPLLRPLDTRDPSGDAPSTSTAASCGSNGAT